MIDINKKYTFNGCNGVLVTTTRNNMHYPVVWIGDDDGGIYTFTSDGRYSLSKEVALIEVKQTRWINVYPFNDYPSKEAADYGCADDRIACIEFKEGDGI